MNAIARASATLIVIGGFALAGCTSTPTATPPASPVVSTASPDRPTAAELETFIESSEAEAVELVRKVANGLIDDGVLTGPVISASCNATSGTTPDAVDRVTVYSCTAVTHSDAEGTQFGYPFQAMKYWVSGQITAEYTG